MTEDTDNKDDKDGHKPRTEMFFVAFNRDGVRVAPPFQLTENEYTKKGL